VGNPKDKVGMMKPQLHLIPSTALIHEARAMENGVGKYGPWNWRKQPVNATVYVSACLRHVLAWMEGEERAADSGVHHLGHARACLGILLDAMEHGCLNDDRPSVVPEKLPYSLPLTWKELREPPCPSCGGQYGRACCS